MKRLASSIPEEASLGAAGPMESGTDVRDVRATDRKGLRRRNKGVGAAKIGRSVDGTGIVRTYGRRIASTTLRRSHSDARRSRIHVQPARRDHPPSRVERPPDGGVDAASSDVRPGASAAPTVDPPATPRRDGRRRPPDRSRARTRRSLPYHGGRGHTGRQPRVHRAPARARIPHGRGGARHGR